MAKYSFDVFNQFHTVSFFLSFFFYYLPTLTSKEISHKILYFQFFLKMLKQRNGCSNNSQTQSS